MAAKVCVNYTGHLAPGQAEKIKAQVADALGILAEDVVFLPGVSLTVVDVPNYLLSAREQDERDRKIMAELLLDESARQDATLKEINAGLQFDHDEGESK